MEDAIDNLGERAGSGDDGVRLSSGTGGKGTTVARKEAKLAAESAKDPTTKKAKRVARAANAEFILRKIPKVERQLGELHHADTEDPLIERQRKRLRGKLAKLRRSLLDLGKLGALDDKEQFGTQVRPQDEGNRDQEEEFTDGDQFRTSKKRTMSESSLGDNEVQEEINEDTAATKVICINDTTKKIKKEKRDKKDKKHKKPQIDNSPQGSSQLLHSVPAFEEHTSEEPANIEDINTNKTAVFNRRTDKYVIQDVSIHPTPEQLKQSALLDTITRARDRSESTGGDRIYQALLASMLGREPPSPPSPMSSIDQPRSLVEVGQATIPMPILPNSQKPIQDRALRAQAVGPKKDIAPPRRESPILPPQRSFSSTRIVPAAKDAPGEMTNEKTMSKKKDTQGSKKSRQSSSSKPDRNSQESPTLAQTVTFLKEAASATFIEGLFSQTDPFNTKARILPLVKASVSRKLSFPSNIDSSSPNLTPTPKFRPSKRMESEAEDWEVASGRIRARVDKQGTDDDGEAEESVAFSSTYLQARPRGITISGIKFQVLNILSGTEQELSLLVDKEGFKICSVAKGRVTVSLGTKKFTIGEGGMFRVRGGEKCVVTNQLNLHAIAVVHVCAVEG
ncbi:hypothetical protein BKA65DRAFT_481810 [Rhexocercosporidium sp. MPI-PUGE-AT-0058]|nr:hypothetical protein BKA65DRAFT_481810 [Rhexocercosporidium sp. MPI-PUGE-AT-0058]